MSLPLSTTPCWRRRFKHVGSGQVSVSCAGSDSPSDGELAIDFESKNSGPTRAKTEYPFRSGTNYQTLVTSSNHGRERRRISHASSAPSDHIYRKFHAYSSSCTTTLHDVSSLLHLQSKRSTKLRDQALQSVDDMAGEDFPRNLPLFPTSVLR